ncbi:MAG: hypothetical protein Q7U38_20205 [Methylobacter sp.]|nr:hypothetical protein [Methylobacter sp.]MDP2096996.1 hypothetical protein [Methylobacter sp.]MDP2428909.1 hypothetical protein [Methylobacter sp.]MDP3056324.1 hypothetical protein [Methylobacter sp.]MDP3361107.1 hypothetical protein [Methylobacter sp.]
MSKSITAKKLALCSLTGAALAVASQGAFAHTRLETNTVVERTRVHNQINVGHGCDKEATIGTSVVFPNAIGYSPVIGIDSGAGRVFTTTAAADYYSPLAGIGTLMRVGGPWELTNNKVDALGNKSGFWAGGKAYDQTISTVIGVEFYSAAVTIKAESCARSVTFYPTIADICSSTPSATASAKDVQIWSPIPNFDGVPGQPFDVDKPYSLYDGYADAAHTTKAGGWNSPASLKVTRNLAINPLPAGCTGNGGAGDDVFVYPSAEQINKELPVWSNADQTGTNYWQ